MKCEAPSRRKPDRLREDGTCTERSATYSFASAVWRGTVTSAAPRDSRTNTPRYRACASNTGCGGPQRTALEHRLLELNGNDLLHGSYGIQKNEVVLTEALELEHLDFEEFLSAYESITLALASHIRELASFREAR